MYEYHAAVYPFDSLYKSLKQCKHEINTFYLKSVQLYYIVNLTCAVDGFVFMVNKCTKITANFEKKERKTNNTSLCNS